MNDRLIIAALRQATGATYDQLRDVILADRPRYEPLWKREGERPTWRSRLTARILDGWVADGSHYRAFADEVAAIDWDESTTTLAGPSGVWRGLAARAEPKHLPLLWEKLWKHAASEPANHLMGYLHMMGELPHEDSIEPLLACLEQSTDPGVQDAAHLVLLTTPQRDLPTRCAKARRRHGYLSGLYGRIATAGGAT